MRPTSLLALSGLLVASLQAQTGSDSFEVATVKVAAPPAGRGGPGGPGGPGGGRGGRGPVGGPGTNDPARIQFQSATLKSLLVYAYGVKSFQITGPTLLDTERYDIEARIAPDASKDQVAVMVQNLLATRFNLKLHRASKELPQYSMVLAKSGSKLKVSAPVDPQKQDDAPPAGPPPNGPRGGLTFDSDGFPVFPGGMPGGPGRGRGGLNMMMAPGSRARIMGTQATAADLAARLTELLARPVTDATGLTAKYDIKLTFSTEGLNIPQGGPGGPGGRGGPAGGPGGPDDMQPQGDPPPELFTAIQSQLGLRLSPQKGSVDLLIIDHADKVPVEN